MKIQTNQGECELTAEMVCRGMVFAPKDPRDYALGKGRVFVVGHRDEANGVWRDARDSNLGTNVFGAATLLGCDPAIASRADCERYGIPEHIDAGAHWFARLRGGGAVDLWLTPVAGLVTEDGIGQRRVLDGVVPRDERFLGLDASHASPEVVERLCCGTQPSYEDLAPCNGCTLAIGPHDMHEDIATGVRWRDPAKEPAVKIGWYSAQMAEVSGTSIYRTPDGRTVEVTCVTDGEDHPMAWHDVRRVGPVAEFVRRGRPAATWTYLQDARPITLTTMSGFRSDGSGDLWGHADAVDASSFAQAAMKGHVHTTGNITFAISSNQKPAEVAQAVVDKMVSDRALEFATETRDCIAACPVGLDCAGWSGAVQALASYRQGNGSLAHMSLAMLVQIVTPALVRGATIECGKIHHIALSAYRKAATEARARDEAPIVALVNVCPEGLDPVGWRAAVLALREDDPAAFDGNVHNMRPALATLLGQFARTGGIPSTFFPDAMFHAYQRALAPRAKVAPERKGMTWKTRGPALPVDDGRDDD